MPRRCLVAGTGRERRASPSRCAALLLVLCASQLVLQCVHSAGSSSAFSRRASLLSGAASEGLQRCFAPFLHRRVEYRLEANAAWGFGHHDSTVGVSATVLVSTELAGETKNALPAWVHTLDIMGMVHSKSYAGHGSPQTVTSLTPVNAGQFRVRIVQTDCNRFDDIIHSPRVSPQELDFARGLVSMIVFALPSDDARFRAQILQAGLHGPRALLSINRDTDLGKRVTHVKRLINETRSSLSLEDKDAAPLRDEISYVFPWTPVLDQRFCPPLSTLSTLFLARILCGENTV